MDPDDNDSDRDHDIDDFIDAEEHTDDEIDHDLNDEHSVLPRSFHSLIQSTFRSLPMPHFLERPYTVRNFIARYKVLSVALLPGHERQSLEHGGKIILPPSALRTLTERNSLITPMMFKITNLSSSQSIHAGVLEFIAATGKCHMPTWMMRTIGCQDDDTVKVEKVTLPIATYSKFQPLSVDFLDISNAKAMLENALRNFACLTTGDIISINYNQKIYQLRVLETQPGPAVNIIECDMNVDFVAPEGYKDPQVEPSHYSNIGSLDAPISGFIPFQGEGQRLDGKPKTDENQVESTIARPLIRGQPDYNYEVGSLTFIRRETPKDPDPPSVRNSFQAFGGIGHALKEKSLH